MTVLTIRVCETGQPERRVPGIEIQLLEARGSDGPARPAVLASATTDSFGLARFALPESAATFLVCARLPDGWLPGTTTAPIEDPARWQSLATDPRACAQVHALPDGSLIASNSGEPLRSVWLAVDRAGEAASVAAVAAVAEVAAPAPQPAPPPVVPPVALPTHDEPGPEVLLQPEPPPTAQPNRALRVLRAALVVAVLVSAGAWALTRGSSIKPTMVVTPTTTTPAPPTTEARPTTTLFHLPPGPINVIAAFSDGRGGCPGTLPLFQRNDVFTQNGSMLTLVQLAPHDTIAGTIGVDGTFNLNYHSEHYHGVFSASGADGTYQIDVGTCTEDYHVVFTFTGH